MMPDLQTLLRQAMSSITEPRAVARWVMTFDLPRGMRWEVLLLVVLFSVVLQYLQVSFLGDPSRVVLGEILARPFTAGIIQASALVIAIFAIYWIGRAMGGEGDFGDAILLVAWLQFCIFLLGVLQVVFQVIMPPIAVLISLLSIGVMFWLLTNFIAELHGFSSLAQVFVMILVSLMGLAFGMSLIFSLIGLSVPGTEGYV